jgi:hypothetical protein
MFPGPLSRDVKEAIDLIQASPARARTVDGPAASCAGPRRTPERQFQCPSDSLSFLCSVGTAAAHFEALRYEDASAHPCLQCNGDAGHHKCNQRGDGNRRLPFSLAQEYAWSVRAMAQHQRSETRDRARAERHRPAAKRSSYRYERARPTAHAWPSG